MTARLLVRWLLVAGLFSLTTEPWREAGAAASFHRLDGAALTLAQIDAEVGRLMKARQVPGLAVTLIENGHPVFVKTYGLAKVETKQPLQNDTIVYAASGQEMQRRVFDRFRMKRTSMTWREDFASKYADGYDEHGKSEPHDRRESVRAAGSMDTTIEDYAKFLAGFLRGEGLSGKAKAEMLQPQIAIRSAHQFPTLEQAENSEADARIGLSAGLGCVLFRGPFGPVFYKGGHNEWTDNIALGIPAKKRGLLLMSNSILAETIYPALVTFLWARSGCLGRGNIMHPSFPLRFPWSSREMPCNEGRSSDVR